MIIFFSVILKELFLLGRDYPFPKLADAAEVHSQMVNSFFSKDQD